MNIAVVAHKGKGVAGVSGAEVNRYDHFVWCLFYVIDIGRDSTLTVVLSGWLRAMCWISGNFVLRLKSIKLDLYNCT